MLQQAMTVHRQGRQTQAEAMYRHILQREPGFAPAQINLGAALMEQGRPLEALTCFEAALRFEPDNAIGLNNRGNALGELGRHEDALASYERATDIDPHYASAFSNRSRVLLSLGRHEAAVASAERALQLNPHSAAALNNLGKAFAALGRDADALRCFDRALELQPGWAIGLSNRSSMLLRLGRVEEALREAEQAARFAPHDAQAANAKGAALQALQQHQQALHCFEEALRRDPTLTAAQYNRGMVLIDLQQPAGALAAFDQALAMAADCAEAHYGRGISLTQLQQPHQAFVAFERAVAMQPELPYARGLSLHARLQTATWDRYEERRAGVIEASARGERVDEPFSFLTISSSAAEQLQCARRFATDRHPPREPLVSPDTRYRHPRLRIAYLSGDLGEHPVSYLMAGVFEGHDREHFETIALSLRAVPPGAFGQRVRAAFDRFIDVTAQSDERIGRLIRELEIDILVDLMGYTRGTRLGVLARRPAPLQVSYLGFPGTLGVPYLDYLIADEVVIPAQSREMYCERIVSLPDCFQANDARRMLPPAGMRAHEHLPDRGLVFCCFNTSCKITPTLFDIWCRLLSAAPGSVLWLLGEHEITRANLVSEAARRGIAPQRLLFAERVPYTQHLARLQLADIFLDTYPFNAGATASDALWAGVPLLTCAGEAFASRMAASLLRSVGLSELIADSLQDYEHRGRQLVCDRTRLAGLKQALTAQRTTSPLFDTARVCRQLEAAYHHMYDRRVHGELPASFDVEAGVHP
jgi:predicted O-linked N-acetylglucosamine transferase (SPINDLY family)